MTVDRRGFVIRAGAGATGLTVGSWVAGWSDMARRIAYLMTVRTRLLREGEDALVARTLRNFFTEASTGA